MDSLRNSSRSDKGSPFPSTIHLLLLKACLYDDDQAYSSWLEWRNQVDFETEIDGPAFRLLPFLYFNLLRLGVDDPLMGRLKGIYRQAWSNNHLLFFRAGEVLKLLNERRIDSVVLKGLSLTLISYRNYGIRPMSDMDVLVKKRDVSEVLKVLEEDGFSISKGQSLQYALRYSNSVSLSGEADFELDLHWNPIIEGNNLSLNHDWWSNAIPVKVGGQATLAMSYENMLLHTLVHGLRYNPEPPIRWIPDAIYLINNRIDWAVFTTSTIHLKVGLTVIKGLSFLREEFGSMIPQSVFDEIRKKGFTLIEKFAFRYAVSAKNIPPKSWGGKLASNYFFYLRQTRFSSPVLQFIGFLKYSLFSVRSKSALIEQIHQVYSKNYLGRRL